MLPSHYSSSLRLVLANLFKMSSLFEIFNKPLSKAMTDNVENKFCNIVDLISLHIWSMYCSIA